MRVKHWRLRYKFLLFNVLAVALSLVLSVAGILGTSHIFDFLQLVEQRDLAAFDHLSQTKALVLEARIYGRHALLEASPELITKNIAKSKEKRAAALGEWALYSKLDSTGQIKKLAEDFGLYWENFVKEYDQIYSIALPHNAENQQIGVDLLDQNNGRALIDTIDNLMKAHRQEAEISRQNAEATFNIITWLIVGSALIVLLLNLGATSWLTTLISRPIYKLHEAALAISAGDLSKRILAVGHDEISELAQAFNQMAENLRIAQQTRFQLSEKVTNQMLVLAGELRINAHQQASGSQEQAASVYQVNKAMTELSATASSIADTSQGISQAALQTLQTSKIIEQTAQVAVVQAQSGQQASEKTREASQEVARLYQELVETMQGLNAKTADMQQIMNVLNSIADETHMLALNAAIEAAGIRAGTEGARFGVIAQEVQTLATRSRTSSKEVVKIVQEVELAIHCALKLAEAGNLKATELTVIAHQANEVIETMRQIAFQSQIQAQTISQMAGETKQLAEAIQVSTYQQKVASQQVAETSTCLSQIADQTSSGSIQVSTTAVRLEEVTQELGVALAS